MVKAFPQFFKLKASTQTKTAWLHVPTRLLGNFSRFSGDKETEPTLLALTALFWTPWSKKVCTQKLREAPVSCRCKLPRITITGRAIRKTLLLDASHIQAVIPQKCASRIKISVACPVPSQKKAWKITLRGMKKFRTEKCHNRRERKNGKKCLPKA